MITFFFIVLWLLWIILILSTFKTAILETTAEIHFDENHKPIKTITDVFFVNSTKTFAKVLIILFIVLHCIFWDEVNYFILELCQLILNKDGILFWLWLVFPLFIVLLIIEIIWVEWIIEGVFDYYFDREWDEILGFLLIFCGPSVWLFCGCVIFLLSIFFPLHGISVLLLSIYFVLPLIVVIPILIISFSCLPSFILNLPKIIRIIRNLCVYCGTRGKMVSEQEIFLSSWSDSDSQYSGKTVSIERRYECPKCGNRWETKHEVTRSA